MYDVEITGPDGSIVRQGSDRVVALNVATAGTSQLLASMGGRLMGWSIRETTGTGGCVVDLYDGDNASGTKLFTIGTNAGSNSNQWLGPGGVDCVTGLYASFEFGSAVVTALYRFDSGSF